MPNDYLYEHLAGALRAIAHSPRLAPPFSGFARVLQRYTQTLHLLKSFSFDAVIDGGANVGEFAELVKMGLPQANLVCVEPHPGCAQKLRDKGFDVVEAALWAESRLTLDLVQVNESSTSSRLGAAAISRPSWKVNTLRLDAVPVSGQRILVKLDLQGAELEALSGLGSLWERCQGFIIETRMGPQGNFQALQELFEGRGFTNHGTINQLYEGDMLTEVDQVWIRHAKPSTP
jgi:FkbM family methyltransferase